MPSFAFSDNQLRCRQARQSVADGRLRDVKMSSHLGYGAAALIREQAEDIVVAHGLSVGQRLGNGLRRYASHDLAFRSTGRPGLISVKGE